MKSASDGTYGVAEEQAAELVRGPLLSAIEQQLARPTDIEARIHRALDLLRGPGADPALRARLELISCALFQMNQLKRDGRVNHYASQLLRLRSVARSL